MMRACGARVAVAAAIYLAMLLHVAAAHTEEGPSHRYGELVVAWEHKAANSSYHYASVVAAPDGSAVYALQLHQYVSVGSVVKVNASDGATMWSVSTEGLGCYRSQWAGGSVSVLIMLSEDGRTLLMQCLNVAVALAATTGRVQWNMTWSNLDQPSIRSIIRGDSFITQTSIEDKTSGNTTYTIAAVSVLTGRRLWAQPLVASLMQLVASRSVVVMSPYGVANITAYSLSSGRILWEAPPHDYRSAFAPTFTLCESTNTLVVRNESYNAHKRSLFGVDASTGALKFTYTIPKSWGTVHGLGIQAVPNTATVVFSTFNYVAGISTVDGALIWKYYNTYKSSSGWPARVVGRAVLLLTPLNNIFVLSAIDGQQYDVLSWECGYDTSCENYPNELAAAGEPGEGYLFTSVYNNGLGFNAALVQMGSGKKWGHSTPWKYGRNVVAIPKSANVAVYYANSDKIGSGTDTMTAMLPAG